MSTHGESSKEFKMRIMDLHLKDNIPIKIISEKFGISQSTIYSWRDQYRKYGDDAFVGCGHQRPGDHMLFISQMMEPSSIETMGSAWIPGTGDYFLPTTPSIMSFTNIRKSALCYKCFYFPPEKLSPVDNFFQKQVFERTSP